MRHFTQRDALGYVFLPFQGGILLIYIYTHLIVDYHFIVNPRVNQNSGKMG